MFIQILFVIVISKKSSFSVIEYKIIMLNSLSTGFCLRIENSKAALPQISTIFVYNTFNCLKNIPLHPSLRVWPNFKQFEILCDNPISISQSSTEGFKL